VFDHFLVQGKKLKRRLRGHPLAPRIAREAGALKPGAAEVTFVLVCGPDFDTALPNAGMTCRMGWCRGFEELGVPYLLVSIFELAARLPQIANPLCWISAADYLYLDDPNLRALKRSRHIAWVDPWFKGDREFLRSHGYPPLSCTERINRRVLASEPSLVFTISPESSFEYYRKWSDHGAQLVSLPLACDASLYCGEPPVVTEFGELEMAFVGGYWPYKARQFDRYLKPYQERLKVFGYSPWPYSGYGGRLEERKEPALYRQARLSPTINEPHVEKMGIDLNERVFKVLGSGGMTVTDVTPGYREWFAADELLVPGSFEEFHELVRCALTDDDVNLAYRKKGREAVLARHTYRHRAERVLELLGLQERSCAAG
jgi:hypothetical protein